MGKEPVAGNEKGPFLEYWQYSITFQMPQHCFNDVLALRRNVIVNLEADEEVRDDQTQTNAPSDKAAHSVAPPYETLEQLHYLSREVKEMVREHMDGPDHRSYMIDYEEHPGSLTVVFTVLGIIYIGVSGYGSFRSGLDYLRDDLRSAMNAPEAIRAKIRRRFLGRRELKN